MDNELERVEKPLITMEGVTLRRRDTLLLHDTFWEICTGQNWAIGSGKSILARALKGDIPYVQGRLIRHAPEVAGE